MNTHLMEKRCLSMSIKEKDINVCKWSLCFFCLFACLFCFSLFVLSLRQRNLNSQLPCFFVSLGDFTHLVFLPTFSTRKQFMLHFKISFRLIVKIQVHTSQTLLYVSLCCFNLADAMKITERHSSVGYLKKNDTVYNPWDQI